MSKLFGVTVLLFSALALAGDNFNILDVPAPAIPTGTASGDLSGTYPSPTLANTAQARTDLGLGSIATQAASAVAITGGTVNGTTIGASTPSSGSFTTVDASGTSTLVTVNTSGAITETFSQNAGSNIAITNANAGAATFAAVRATNDASSGQTRMIALGTAFTTSGAFVQDGGVFECGTALSGGCSVVANVSPYRLYVGGSGTVNLVEQVSAITHTFSDAIDLSFGSSTGNKIGTATSQKIAFYNSTPIIQPVATTDLGTVLSNLGLRAAGTAYPVTTTGAVSFGGGIAEPGIVTDTATATIVSTTRYARCNKATAMTENLPTSGMVVGQLINIKNINVGACTVDAAAGNTIDGAQTNVLSAQYQSISLLCVAISSGVCTTWDIL